MTRATGVLGNIRHQSRTAELNRIPRVSLLRGEERSETLETRLYETAPWFNLFVFYSFSFLFRFLRSIAWQRDSGQN